jgi:hypothetical protein
MPNRQQDLVPRHLTLHQSAQLSGCPLFSKVCLGQDNHGELALRKTMIDALPKTVTYLEFKLIEPNH